MVVFQISKFAGFNLVEDEGSDMNQFDQQDFKSNLDFVDLRFIFVFKYIWAPRWKPHVSHCFMYKPMLATS